MTHIKFILFLFSKFLLYLQLLLLITLSYSELQYVSMVNTRKWELILLLMNHIIIRFDLKSNTIFIYVF